MTAIPTRKDEAWRYSDLEAVARLWPLAAPEQIHVGVGEDVVRSISELPASGIARMSVEVEPNGHFYLHALVAHRAYGRLDIDVRLQDGATFTFGGVIIGSDAQTLEIVTKVRHCGEWGVSRQTVRSVLGGTATGSYLGKVAVSRDAQKTDSVQSVKAMLLDRTATANAKPELEIYADDVKCAHGATVGELDKNALFYLAARGLPPAEAQTLLLQAFVAEVFEGAEAQAELETAALAALERMS